MQDIREATDTFGNCGRLTRILHAENTTSTQDDLARLWHNNEILSGTALIADSQSAGRGRVGRSWFSTPEGSLLISVLIEVPQELRHNLGWVTLTGALAAQRALQALAIDTQISWPNDIVVQAPTTRKIAGIIGEFIGERDGKLAVVLGMGLNITLADNELPTPTSASLATAGYCTPSRDKIAARYIFELFQLCDRLAHALGNAETAGLLAELNAKCETLKPNVTVNRPHANPVVGTGKRVLADGSLEMETETGTVVITTGEVSMLDETTANTQG
ncbi:biotin--[acetyl-CoA-carboxylase] ligase [Actinotignum urinale]|uniref:biotin--[acetyl-CoA-carboxylase] ligase n=1 Tax=Actinotignum urinale TaxID=190146 RepID=UPI00370D8E1D